MCLAVVSRLGDGANDGFKPGSSSISGSGRARAQRMGGPGGARSSHHVHLRIWKNASPRNGWPRRSPKFSSHLSPCHVAGTISRAFDAVKRFSTNGKLRDPNLSFLSPYFLTQISLSIGRPDFRLHRGLSPIGRVGLPDCRLLALHHRRPPRLSALGS
ncbi:hypothetical protein ACFX1R_037650 [Malus domestica]